MILFIVIIFVCNSIIAIFSIVIYSIEFWTVWLYKKHLISYAVLRGVCQRWALDTKPTCYGISFDGKAAFPSVDRNIQIRELYGCGESGDLLKYSKCTYQNTLCRIKLNDTLSREIHGSKGSRQGHILASGHFKTYINPCLNVANTSALWFFIGPICICAICIADDTYMS